MTKITENSIIIEISTGTANPLEELGNLQQGLLNLIGIINYEEPVQEIQNGLWHLRKLLKELTLSPAQLACISDAIVSSDEFKKAFAA